jgi:hypothetical protein
MKLKKIHESSSQWSAIVLDDESHKFLVKSYQNPGNWKVFAHHMTINPFGKTDIAVDETVILKVTEFGMSDRAFAVKVKGYSGKTNNSFPHVTIYVNAEAGAKPKESNDIENWASEKRNIVLRGIVKNIQHG